MSIINEQDIKKALDAGFKAGATQMRERIFTFLYFKRGALENVRDFCESIRAFPLEDNAEFKK